MDTATLIDATASPVSQLGGAFYFTSETAAVAERLGLDVFMLYCLGRGGVLGDDVDVDKVVDAFRWFAPGLVRTLWQEGREITPPSKAAAAYLEAARDYARRTFAASPALEGFCPAAERVVAAAPTRRWPFVDGYRRFELAEDVVARAYQLVVVLREMRGAAHAEAVAELGLSPAEAHYLTSADQFELYGYDATDVPVVTEELVERRALAEDRTTDLLVGSYSVLDADGSGAFLEGVRELAATADIDVEDVAV